MRVAERAGGCGPTARVPCVAAAAAAAATALAGARRSRGAQRQGSRQMGPRIRIRVEAAPSRQRPRDAPGRLPPVWPRLAVTHGHTSAG